MWEKCITGLCLASLHAVYHDAKAVVIGRLCVCVVYFRFDFPLFSCNQMIFLFDLMNNLRKNVPQCVDPQPEHKIGIQKIVDWIGRELFGTGRGGRAAAMRSREFSS